jgi:hypothetical protein
MSQARNVSMGVVTQKKNQYMLPQTPMDRSWATRANRAGLLDMLAYRDLHVTVTGMGRLTTKPSSAY